MESLAESNGRRIANPQRNRSRRLLFGIVALLVLTAAVLLVPSPSPKRGFVWLSRPEFARLTRIGPWTELKYRFLRLVAPLLATFRRNQPQVRVTTSFLNLTPEQIAGLGLGLASETNADGARAWLLTPSQCDTLRQHIKELPGESNLGGPTVTLGDGTEAQVFAGGNSLPGQVSPAGIRLSLSPRISGGSVQLLLSVSATEGPPLNQSNAFSLRTNLDVACRVMVPNAGSLLIAPGEGTSADRRQYFGLLCPTAYDARGNLIKP